MVIASTPCSERSSGAGFGFESVAGGSRGIVGASIALSYKSWRRTEGKYGWLLARGDGGAVILRMVLNARRNCLADKFFGKTYTE